MTVPPPSDPSQPNPLESDGHDLVNHDLHEDTGPLRVPAEVPLEQSDWVVVEHPSRPIGRFDPHDEGPWSGGFQAPPPPVIPRQVRVRAKPDIPVWPIAIAVAVIVGC